MYFWKSLKSSVKWRRKRKPLADEWQVVFQLQGDVLRSLSRCTKLLAQARCAIFSNFSLLPIRQCGRSGKRRSKKGKPLASDDAAKACTSEDDSDSSTEQTSDGQAGKLSDADGQGRQMSSEFLFLSSDKAFHPGFLAPLKHVV